MPSVITTIEMELYDQYYGKENHTKTTENTHGSTSVFNQICTYEADLIKQ